MTTFGPFYYIWTYWSLIESLTQCDEIFGNFLDFSMFRILSITFATDLQITWSLCRSVDNSDLQTLWEGPRPNSDCKVDKISIEVGVQNLDNTLSRNI